MIMTIAEYIFFYGVALLFTLSFVIAFHEFGHYFAARLCGIRIDKFSIGFGKELYGFTDRYGTRWSLSRIPLGGYVQILGDVDINNPVIWDRDKNCARKLSEEELAVSYCTKPVWQRICVVLAGPMANFFLTFFLLFSLFTIKGAGYAPAVINALGVESASYAAGFRLGDQVLEMNGQKIRRWTDIHRITWFNPEKEFTYKILRDGQEIEIKAKVRKVNYTDKKGVERSHGRTGMVSFRGISFKEITSVNGIDTKDDPKMAEMLISENMDQIIRVGLQFKLDKESLFIMRIPSEHNQHLFNDVEDEKDDTVFLVNKEDAFYMRLSPLEAIYESYYVITKTLKETKDLLGAVHKGKTEEPPIAGVAKISEHVGKAAKKGVYTYIIFAAIFSLAIGLINLLPIPVLDGGHLLFLSYELVVRKPVPQKIQDRAFILGLILLGGIMIFANINDLVRLLFTLE
ncbi:MAG: RIP metalloprotease RseP [Alphaproteobacteria bacterium]|nr:RIP metalloprotease RseP [Alphaproteobacteria bacterium]